MVLAFVFFWKFSCLQAQIDDVFDYDSLRYNTEWEGDTQAFIIDNYRLRSNSELANATFFLSRKSFHHDTTEWLIQMELKFNPSSANYVDWFLMADTGHLPSVKNAYYVRIGNTKDEVSLYKKVNGQTPVLLIDGTDDILNKSNNLLTVRVLRTFEGTWSLSVNTQGQLNPMSLEGVTTDTTLSALPHTGLLIRQSTASFFQKHFFSLYYMGKEIRDSIAPYLLQSNWIGEDSISLVFSEQLDSLAATNPANFILAPSLIIQSIHLSDSNTKVGLKLASPLVSLTTYTLTLKNITDEEQNSMRDTSLSYRYLKPESANPYDLVINEIMATPSPSVGLPEYSYIEIYNRSAKVIDLTGFKLADRVSTATISTFLLLPDSFLIICSHSGVASLSIFGTTKGVSNFPTFNKTEDDVILRDANNNIIHNIRYTDRWYGNEFKKNGGFSLEMIDPSNPCGGSENWAASTHLQGGTPASHNTVKSSNSDNVAPTLLSAYPLNPSIIELRFSEELDSFSCMNTNQYTIKELSISPVAVTRCFMGIVHLQWDFEFEPNIVYTLALKGLSDCSGNFINETSIRVGMFDTIQKGDILINEILFNPPAELSEFVEIYNISNKILDLKNLRLGNLKDDGSFRDFTTPVSDGMLLFPQQYVVFSTSGTDLCTFYTCLQPRNIFRVKSMPSFPQKSGGVVLTDSKGQVLDSFLYNESMHFKMITDKKGLSLERIEFERPATDPTNWTSATANAGFATPGYENSQSRKPSTSIGQVWLDPEVFSPDGNGIDDLLNIRFNLEKNGFVANVYIYNASGVFVAHPIRNHTIANSGTLIWDGFLDATTTRCPIGIYIILFEAFHENGDVVRKKIACTLISSY